MPDKQRAEQGERFKKIREDLGFTQAQLAEVLGITQPQLSRFEKGVNSISLEILAKVLEIDPKYNINWLVTGQGEMEKVATNRIMIAADDEGVYLTSRDFKIAKLESFIKSKFSDYDDM
jgi:transcriptional regulator with XRE-family HTH domain